MKRPAQKPAEIPSQLVLFALSALVGGGFGMALFPPVPASGAADATAEESPAEAAFVSQPLLLEPAENVEDGTCQLSVEVTGALRDGARLQLHQMSKQGTLDVRAAAPYGSGVVRFTDVAPGTYHVTALADGAALAAAPTWTCAGDGERAFFRLPLEGDAVTVTGKVVGFENAPAPGTEVLLEQQLDERNALLGVAHVPVAVDGTFTAQLRPGEYRLLALAPHHTAEVRTIRVTADRSHVVELKLPWKPEASGTVVGADGSPVAGAEVFVGPLFDPNARPEVVVTDEQGQFTVPVKAGRSLILAARKDGLIGGVRLGAAKSLEGHTDVVLTALEGRTVSGFVQKQSGLPHGFGEVEYRVKSAGIVGRVQADADGRFSIPGMPPTDVEVWSKDSAIGAWGGAVATVDQPRVLLTHVDPAYARR